MSVDFFEVLADYYIVPDAYCLVKSLIVAFHEFPFIWLYLDAQ